MRFIRTLLLALSLTSTRAHSQALLVPRRARVDSAFPVVVTGLAHTHRGTIVAEMIDSVGRVWRASATFAADPRGRISTASLPPLSGDYLGRQPLGLVSSMDVEGEERGRIRFIAPGLTALPLHLKLVVDGIVRDTASVQRFLLDTGIAAQHVDTNGVVGVLYTPQTRRNRGAVLVLGGSEGGIGGADVAALLASHGYVALAIAYFGVAGLPSELARIPLEGFTRALDLLEHRQGVRGAPLAIVGTSKGAEAALLVATRDTRVRAVVAYAPSAVSWSCICAAAQDPSWVEGGASVAFVPPGRDPSYQPTRGEPVRSVINYRYRVADSSVAYRAEIPVERVRGRVLLVAGTDDALWPSAWSAQRIAVRSAAQGRAAQVNVLEYAGAGHLIGKAYLPSGSTLVAGGRLDTGGSAAANARAQADSWPRVLSFLSRELARRN